MPVGWRDWALIFVSWPQRAQIELRGFFAYVPVKRILPGVPIGIDDMCMHHSTAGKQFRQFLSLDRQRHDIISQKLVRLLARCSVFRRYRLRYRRLPQWRG